MMAGVTTASGDHLTCIGGNKVIEFRILGLAVWTQNITHGKRPPQL